MKIALFFSYKNSVKSWYESGILSRELEIYRMLNKKYNFQYIFITYGHQDDIGLVKDKFIKVIPIYKYFKKSKSNIVNIFKSLLFPFKIRSVLKKTDYLQQNQLNGVWISIVAKIIVGKPLYVRTGYDLVLFNIKNKKNFLKVTLYKFFTYLALNMATIYTVTSKQDYEHLINNYSFKKSKLKLHRNWVVTGQKNFGSKEGDILCVGRLESQKNYLKILNDFKNTKDSVRIDIVGEGSLKENLKLLAQKNKVNVKFLGKLDNVQLKDLYSNYKFFISSSLFEGNPKSLLEAMGAGCIVLASDIPNHRELIDNKVNGVLIELYNGNFYKKYMELKENKKLIDKISKNSIKKIQECNSIDVISSLIYKEITTPNGK